MIFWWCWTAAALIGVLLSIQWNRRTWCEGFCFVLGIASLRWMLTPMANFEVLGHSTQYLAVYQGASPTTGDTSFYPMMQILWWLIGRVAPAQVPFFGWGLLWGAVSIVLLARQKNAWNWLVFGWFLCWPLHWQWSFSGYNVIVPFAFMAMGYHFLQQQKWLGLAAAMSLAIGCRVESLLVWGIFWAQLGFSAGDMDWRRLSAATLVSCIPILGMLQFPIPGEGDVYSSWENNWKLFSLYRELGFGLVILGGWYGIQRRFKRIFWMGAVFGILHLLMIGFNDWSSRHLLLLGFLMVLGLQSIQPRQAVGYLLIMVNFIGLMQSRALFYASPESFVEAYSRRYGSDTASVGSCAWVVEEEMFLMDNRRPLSHFNLLSTEEVDGLTQQYGCIQWCKTHQDWHWTELDIRDRATRLMHLYEWQVEGWYWSGGNACLVHRLQ